MFVVRVCVCVCVLLLLKLLLLLLQRQRRCRIFLIDSYNCRKIARDSVAHWGEGPRNRRIEHWAIRSFVCLFARTTHSLACSALLASLARSAALIHLPVACSLTHCGAQGKEIYVCEMNTSISTSF